MSKEAEAVTARDFTPQQQTRFPAGNGDVCPGRRYLHDECFDFSSRPRSGYHRQRRPVGHRARSAGLGRVHPDRQQDRRSLRQETRLCTWPARVCNRGDCHDIDAKPDTDHHFLGHHRRARRIAVAACHAVADPRQFRRRGHEESLCGSRRGRPGSPPPSARYWAVSLPPTCPGAWGSFSSLSSL